MGNLVVRSEKQDVERSEIEFLGLAHPRVPAEEAIFQNVVCDGITQLRHAGEHPAQTLIRRCEPIYQHLHKEISRVRLIGGAADHRAERIGLLLLCHSKIIEANETNRSGSYETPPTVQTRRRPSDVLTELISRLNRETLQMDKAACVLSQVLFVVVSISLLESASLSVLLAL